MVFTVDEFEFLNKYLSVDGPISKASDNLQSNSLYAVLLPTLKILLTATIGIIDEQTEHFIFEVSQNLHLNCYQRQSVPNRNQIDR